MMLVRMVVGLFLCVGLVACSSNSSEESNSEKFRFDACGSIALKVANGQSCDLGDSSLTSPVVRLSILNVDGSSSLCTGSVIASRYVLTAAHCFFSAPTLAVQVFAFNGVADVTQIFIHPEFSANPEGTLLFNDLAVLELAGPMFTYVAPLLTDRSLRVGEEAIVAGFGNRGGDQFGTIRAGNTRVSNITMNHIFSENNGDRAAPCRGDSGGALYVEQDGFLTIAGIVSQADPSAIEKECREGDIVLYTNVNNRSARDFVRSIVPGVTLN